MTTPNTNPKKPKRKSKKQSGYFPNNIAEVMSAEFSPVPVEYVMDEIASGWKIPSSVVCVIRATNNTTGKVTEYSYSRQGAATNRIQKLMQEGHEITIATDDTIGMISAPPIDEDPDDPFTPF